MCVWIVVLSLIDVSAETRYLTSQASLSVNGNINNTYPQKVVMKIEWNKLKYLAQYPTQYISKYSNKSANYFNFLNYNLCGPRDANSFSMAKSSPSNFISS